MQKASPGTDFLGTRKTSKHVQQSTTTIPLWLHHGTESLPYGKVSSATSAVCQGCSKPASSNTMHSFVFFHDRLYEYGYCVTMETQETQHQSLSTEATQKSCEVIMQKRSCLCRCPLDVILLYFSQGLPYGKVSSATSAVSQGFSQPASKNTMHAFPFFHDSLYAYG